MISTWEVPEQWSIAVQYQEQGVSYWLTTAYWSTGLICCWQATPAVCQHKDTGASPDKKTAIGTREFAVSAAVVWNSLPWNYECCPA